MRGSPAGDQASRHWPSGRPGGPSRAEDRPARQTSAGGARLAPMRV